MYFHAPRCWPPRSAPARSKSKLYRFDNDSNEWKERGIGQLKLLQHKENKKVRLLMRQEKTLKIRANHLGGARARGLRCSTGIWPSIWRIWPLNAPLPPAAARDPAAVIPGTTLTEHSGSDKAWVWSAVDFAEGKQSVELFCIRFGSVESE
jgi:Ran-binding protein 1